MMADTNELASGTRKGADREICDKFVAEQLRSKWGVRLILGDD